MTGGLAELLFVLPETVFYLFVMADGLLLSHQTTQALIFSGISFSTEATRSVKKLITTSHLAPSETPNQPMHAAKALWDKL